MAKKLRKAADDIDVSDAPGGVSSAEVDRLQEKLEAAGEVMEAQARLIEAYELRKSRTKELARLAAARKAWEEVNG